MRRLLAVLAALAAAGCAVTGGRSGSSEPPFETVARLGEGIEVRAYGPRAAVEARIPGAGRDRAFGLLFDYISGANDGGRRIAMTVPVATDEIGARLAMTAPVATPAGGGAFAMRFFLPAGMTAADAPAPRDPRLALIDLPAQDIAVLRFPGSREAPALAAAEARLQAALGTSGWAAAGPAEAWFFDPPWTLPPLRRNEIAVPVVRR